MSKPLIGLTADVDLKANGREVDCLYPIYIDAIEGAGGLPLIIPPLSAPSDMRALLARLDGVVLTGGDDYHPSAWGEEEVIGPFVPVRPRRERFDLAFIHVLLEAGTPVLGICGGMQLINIALGGTLYQDLPAQQPTDVAHSLRAPDVARHSVTVEPGTTLNVGTEPLVGRVRSYHHQAIRDVAGELRAIATAPDGVIEALDWPARPGAYGVQWHPEKSIRDDPEDAAFARAVFAPLIEAA